MEIRHQRRQHVNSNPGDEISVSFPGLDNFLFFFFFFQDRAAGLDQPQRGCAAGYDRNRALVDIRSACCAHLPPFRCLWSAISSTLTGKGYPPPRAAWTW